MIHCTPTRLCRLSPFRRPTLPLPLTSRGALALPFPRRTFKSQPPIISAAELRFGQPVHETHPHILEPGHITIGISAQEYEQRRAALAHRLPPGAVAIISAAPVMFRSGAVFHSYRQDSNFLYLTGFNEPDSLAVLQKTGDSWGDYVFHLFVRPKDREAEQWTGPRCGVQAAMDVFNADQADEIGHAGERIAGMVKAASRVYADVERPAPGKPSGCLSEFLENKVAGRVSARPLSPVLYPLRAIKSEAEIANMRRAGQLSGRVLTDAMRQNWTRERDLHAFLDYNFVTSGLDGPAYIPVVGGGDNANVIHYVHNNAMLDERDLVLVDAGGELGMYITDISRTWPVSGKFTPAQRDLYEAVLRVQRQGVSLCRQSSHMSLDDIHNATLSWLVSELSSLGFDVSGRNIDQLFPHHVGHYIGLDVHDIPGYPRREPLRTGHAVTIEPGVYVPADDDRWPKHFRGLGIRIEDSVCVQDDTPLVLTTEAVKEIADIEALRD